MKFILSSTNKAKSEATKQALNKFFGEVELLCVDVDSGVSKTPETDDEGIAGCRNRIGNARLLHPDADGYIGLEGIITRNSSGTFICGWCVIEMNGKTGMGCSAKVQIPEFISTKITGFGELSTLVKTTYPSDLVSEIDLIGTNGIITNKGYTRVDEFVDALSTAIGYLSNEKNY